MANLKLIASEVRLKPEQLRFLGNRGVLDVARITSPTLSLTQAAAETNETLNELKWLAVVTSSNWNRLVSDGLSYTVFPSTRAASMKLMRGGNTILFYVSRIGRVVASAKIIAGPRYANLVWPTGVYPYRVELKPQLIVPLEEGVEFANSVQRLSFISNKAHWEAGVRGALRLLPPSDFRLLQKALASCANRSD